MLYKLENGFKQFSKSIICLDGCFLKGFYKGEILSTVGKDENDQIYPTSWAVVEGKNRETRGGSLKICNQVYNWVIVIDSP